METNNKPLTEADLVVGNRFECIEDYETAYSKGAIYTCDETGHLSSNYSTKFILFNKIEFLNRHFKLLPSQPEVKELKNVCPLAS